MQISLRSTLCSTIWSNRTRAVTVSKDANLSPFAVTRSLLHLLVQIKILNIQHSIVRLLSRLTCAESLSALVYAHVLEAGGLPCRLRLPAHDTQPSDAMLASLLRVESETDCFVRLPRNRAYAELLRASSSSRTGGTTADATRSRSRRRTTAKAHTHPDSCWTSRASAARTCHTRTRRTASRSQAALPSCPAITRPMATCIAAGLTDRREWGLLKTYT